MGTARIEATRTILGPEVHPGLSPRLADARLKVLTWEQSSSGTGLDLRRPTTPLGQAAAKTVTWLQASPATCSLLLSMVAVWMVERALIGQVHQRRILSYLAFGGLPNVTVVGRGNPGQWWRYIANGMVHDRPPLHLISNAVALLLVGAWVERKYGKLAMLGSLILGVAAGNLTWVAVSGLDLASEPDYTVGCSGGVCALVGIMLVHGYRARGTLAADVAHSIRLRATFGIALMVLLGLVLPKLNNYAHGGGFACGLVLGRLLPLTADNGAAAVWRRRGVFGALVLAGVAAEVFAAINLCHRLSAS